MKFKCIWFDCPKKWSNKPSRNEIVVHNKDDHQSNLMFISDRELRRFIRLDEPGLKVERD